MWGAIIGDLAGSIYEYRQYKNVSLINVDKIITEDSFYSDDTILTIAIYDAILNDRSYEDCLREYGNKFLNYKPQTKILEHFKTTFGGGFARWLKGQNDGTSIGNGAMMRISGVGKMFNIESEVIDNAILATIPSHNSKEAIECAQKIALIIYYARIGFTKIDILQSLGIASLSYKPFESFNKTCYETIDNCLYAVFCSNNFEDAIRTIISMGGIQIQMQLL